MTVSDITSTGVCLLISNRSIVHLPSLSSWSLHFSTALCSLCIFILTAFEAIQIARKYNLEAVIRQELASGLSPEEALQQLDIN